MSQEYDLPKFKPSEYLEYRRAPQWEKDGFDSIGAYHHYWCGEVKKMHDESNEAFKPEREVWQICYDVLESTNKRNVGAASVAEEMVAAAKIPIYKNTALDDVAALYAGQFIPSLKALQKSLQPMISLANTYMRSEFILNDWDTLKFDLGLDAFITDTWIAKLFTTDDEPGPFGERLKIEIDRIDPRCTFPDPKAKTTDWAKMDYFGVDEDFDIGVVRNRFKEVAGLIDEFLVESNKDDRNRWAASQLLILPGNKNRWANDNQRKRVHVKEWWLHDSRFTFRAFLATGADGEDELVLDDDGYVKGSWEPAYPKGRMIVTAADKLVLRDIPNPFWHGGLPYIICQQNPHGGRVLSVGKAPSVLAIDRKINDFESRIHAYGQSEIERPMEADVGTFPDNLSIYKTSGQSRKIIIKYPNRQFIRRPPVETPMFTESYLNRMSTRYLNQTVGQSAVLKGDMTEGGQLSAQAMQGVQGNSTTRLAMQSVYIASAMRELGFKLFSLMRQTYKEGLSASVLNAKGEPETVDWDEEQFGHNFLVDVDLQANTPGGQASKQSYFTDLYGKGLLDRQATMQGLNIDDWQETLQRIKSDELERIETQAYGRSLGNSVKQAEKPDADRGAPSKLRAI